MWRCSARAIALDSFGLSNNAGILIGYRLQPVLTLDGKLCYYLSQLWSSNFQDPFLFTSAITQDKLMLPFHLQL